MQYLQDVALWPMIVANSLQSPIAYGPLVGLGVGYYIFGNPLGQGSDLMSLAQTYLGYGVCVTAGLVLAPSGNGSMSPLAPNPRQL